MLKLSFILSFLLWITCLYGQSPHGESFKTDCTFCHTTAGWKVVRKDITFDHDSTRFKLIGQHNSVDCRSCHKSLVFSTAPKECFDCHNDLHEGTLGPDCARCHTPKSWIIENISKIHRQSRFPLTGAHQIGDCVACHKSGSMRRFEPLGIECIDCHRNTYLATTKPNHQAVGYSTNCIQCHSAGSAGWVGANIEHSFFPLTQGHAISCNLCHVSGEFKKIPTDCFSCHQKDYNAAATLNHQQLNFSTNCLECHTTSPKWTPAKFREHDARFFPVYSGRHANTWNNCMECHKQTDNYGIFTCIDCHAHAKSQMDNAHREANGYQYNSIACFTCHPTGGKEGGFNHAKTNFPITGAHVTIDCIGCHAKGFAGTAMDCNSCHKAKFDQAQAPVHITAGIPTSCEPCHNTAAWKPSSFNHTTTGFALAGGHAVIAQCSDCHKGTVLNTRTDCIACHQVQYDNAKDHNTQSYPTDCKMCHNANNWLNATFNHSTTGFPLTGVHLTTLCSQCHVNGFTNTPSACVACHQTNYNQAANPNHQSLGLSVNCGDCHTTNAGWAPATFTIHSNYWVLAGAHSAIATNCALCHNGNYTTTPNTCYGCHAANYNSTTNPNHSTAKFPTTCESCHTVTAWTPATYNHDSQYFPIYSGHHKGKWTLCSECHTTATNYSVFNCLLCHEHSNKASVDSDHREVSGYSYTSAACYSCHPRG